MSSTNNEYYESSSNITVFPSVQRTAYDSKKFTEERLTNMIYQLLPKNNLNDGFVITTSKAAISTGTFEFNIEGYYFKIDDVTSLLTEIAKDTTAKSVWAMIRKGTIQKDYINLVNIDGESTMDINSKFMGLKFLSLATLDVKPSQENIAASLQILIKKDDGNWYIPTNSKYILAPGYTKDDVDKVLTIDSNGNLAWDTLIRTFSVRVKKNSYANVTKIDIQDISGTKIKENITVNDDLSAYAGYYIYYEASITEGGYTFEDGSTTRKTTLESPILRTDVSSYTIDITDTKQCFYTVTFSSNNEEYGTVDPTSISEIKYKAPVTYDTTNQICEIETTTGTSSCTATSTNQKEYEITLDMDGGTPSIDPKYVYANYSFDGWTGPTTITSNTSITANFTKSITPCKLPTASQVEKTGYTLVSWADGETYYAPGSKYWEEKNTTLIAQWAWSGSYYITIPTLTIASLVVIGGDGRELSNNDVIYLGEKVTWTATCEKGYHFYNDNSKLSDGGSETISGDYIVPSTDATISTYSISASVAEGSGSLEITSNPSPSTVKYIPIETSQFSFWNDSDVYGVNIESTNATVSEGPEETDYYIITPKGTGDITVELIGLMSEILFNATHCTITATNTTTSTPVYNGTAVHTGDTITWSATAEDEYVMVEPSSGTFTAITGSNTITATAVSGKTQVTISKVIYPNDAGTITLTPESAPYYQGDTIIITATNYSEGADRQFGKILIKDSADNTIKTITTNSDEYKLPTTYTALKIEADYKMKVSVSSDSGCTAYINSKETTFTYVWPTSYTLNLYAENGTQTFKGWYLDNSKISTKNPYTVTGKILAPRVYVASSQTYSIDITNDDTVLCTSSQSSATYGETVTITIMENGETIKRFGVIIKQDGTTIETKTGLQNDDAFNIEVKGNIEIVAYGECVLTFTSSSENYSWATKQAIVRYNQTHAETIYGPSGKMNKVDVTPIEIVDYIDRQEEDACVNFNAITDNYTVDAFEANYKITTTWSGSDYEKYCEITYTKTENIGPEDTITANIKFYNNGESATYGALINEHVYIIDWDYSEQGTYGNYWLDEEDPPSYLFPWNTKVDENLYKIRFSIIGFPTFSTDIKENHVLSYTSTTGIKQVPFTVIHRPDLETIIAGTCDASIEKKSTLVWENSFTITNIHSDINISITGKY